MFAARVCISTGCPRWASPPSDFGLSQAPIPLCSAACFRSLLAPSHLPHRRLAVPGRHDSRRRCRKQEARSRSPNSVTAARAHRRAYLPSLFSAQSCSTHQPTRFILRYVLNTQQPLLITHFLIDSLLIRQDCH